MLTTYFILGVILGVLFVFISFGTDIKEKSKPRIKINIPPIVKDSHILLFNKHLHHWFIAFLSLNVYYIILMIIVKYIQY